MVVDKVYLKNISNRREKRSMMLSYRRYRRLDQLHGGIGQVIFDKYKDQYTPKIWAYALSLYTHQRIVEPFKKYHFDEAVRIKSMWDEVWSELPYTHIHLTEDQIEKQLKFMGYVKDLKTHDLYVYVSSYLPINGHWWVHPKKYVDNYIALKKRPSVPYIYNNGDYDSYMLEGYTKILKHGT